MKNSFLLGGNGLKVGRGGGMDTVIKFTYLKFILDEIITSNLVTSKIWSVSEPMFATETKIFVKNENKLPQLPVHFPPKWKKQFALSPLNWVYMVFRCREHDYNDKKAYDVELRSTRWFSENCKLVPQPWNSVYQKAGTRIWLWKMSLNMAK